MTYKIKLPEESPRVLELTFDGKIDPEKVRSLMSQTNGVASIRMNWPYVTLTSERGFGRKLAEAMVVAALFKIGLDQVS